MTTQIVGKNSGNRGKGCIISVKTDYHYSVSTDVGNPQRILNGLTGDTRNAYIGNGTTLTHYFDDLDEASTVGRLKVVSGGHPERPIFYVQARKYTTGMECILWYANGKMHPQTTTKMEDIIAIGFADACYYC
jgi:hypothetical protein